MCFYVWQCDVLVKLHHVGEWQQKIHMKTNNALQHTITPTRQSTRKWRRLLCKKKTNAIPNHNADAAKKVQKAFHFFMVSL